MSSEEYKAALSKLGLTQEGAAGPLGIAKRTSQAYAIGEIPVPPILAILLRLLLAGNVSIADLEAART